MLEVLQQSKIISSCDAAAWSARYRENGYAVVHAHGCFDILHPGHVRYLEQAKKLGDRLIVSITSDRHVNKGPGRPMFHEHLRAESLASLACVDAVVINDNPTAVPLIAEIRPRIYAKGTDYANGGGEIHAETRAVEIYGGTVTFIPDGQKVTDTDGDIASSSKIYNRAQTGLRADYLRKARERNYLQKIPELIDQAQKLSVLFIGEQITDEYVYVSPLGKPPKEYVIACLKNETEVFFGGIEAAANHARSFCGKVSAISQRAVVKRRYVDKDYNRKLFEIYEMDDAPPIAEREDEILRAVRELCPAFDVTVVIDFGHGMMTPKIRNAIRTNSNFLAVNAQSNSANHGFNPVTNYGADYICVDAPEARLAISDKRADLNDCARRLSRNAPKVCITDGNRGSIAYAENECVSVPSFADKVVDTMGAGDAFLAVTAPLAKLTNDVEMLAFIGNIVGAIKIGTIGHRAPVEKKQVLRYVQSLLK